MFIPSLFLVISLTEGLITINSKSFTSVKLNSVSNYTGIFKEIYLFEGQPEVVYQRDCKIGKLMNHLNGINLTGKICISLHNNSCNLYQELLNLKNAGCSAIIISGLSDLRHDFSNITIPISATSFESFILINKIMHNNYIGGNEIFNISVSYVKYNVFFCILFAFTIFILSVIIIFVIAKKIINKKMD